MLQKEPKVDHDDAVYNGHRLDKLVLIPFIGPVEEAAWPMLLMSTVVHGGYYVFLTFSYRNVELGQAYPILRGTGPIVVFLASMIFLNEPVSGLQLFAFFLIAGGILSLSLRSFGYFQKQPSTIFYALGTGILIGIYSVIDGIGVRNLGTYLVISAGFSSRKC